MKTLNIESNYNVPVGKLESAVALSTANMTEATLNFIFTHGLKQLINDAHSGKKDSEEIQAAVNKKIASLETNSLNARASGDDVHTEYKRVAFTWLVKNTGQTKKALEECRKANGLTTTALLELVTDKLGLEFETINEEIIALVEAAKVKTSEKAASIDLNALLG